MWLFYRAWLKQARAPSVYLILLTKGPIQYLCLTDGEIMTMLKIKDTLTFFVQSKYWFAFHGFLFYFLFYYLNLQF